MNDLSFLLSPASIATVSVFNAGAGIRLRELDLNPVMANEEGAVAVRWLLSLDDHGAER